MHFAAAGAHSCSHCIAICIHALQNTKGEPITRQNERSATAADTRYFSSPAAATLHEKTQGFVPASSPKQTPCNIRAVITMRLQQHVHIQAAIAICVHALQNTKGVSHVKSNGPQPPHTHEVPFIAGCSHCTRKNASFRSPASQAQAPCNIHAAIKALRHHVANPLVSSHHFPKSPLALVTTSLSPHLPNSPSLRHHFPSSPLPFVTTSLRHHFPRSSLP